jgi:hypothetical protein
LAATSLSAAFPFRRQFVGYESACETVVRARQFPPYSRAAATAFHRLPVHGVSVIVNGARNLRKTQAACAAGTLLLLFAAYSFLLFAYFRIARRTRILNLKCEI